MSGLQRALVVPIGETAVYAPLNGASVWSRPLWLGTGNVAWLSTTTWVHVAWPEPQVLGLGSSDGIEWS